jgi:hypothetical protein
MGWADAAPVAPSAPAATTEAIAVVKIFFMIVSPSAPKNVGLDAVMEHGD